MRDDIKDLQRQLGEFQARPPQESWLDDEITATIPVSKIPAPFRGAGFMLSLLPPGARVLGLAIVAAVVIVGIVYGVHFF